MNRDNLYDRIKEVEKIRRREDETTTDRGSKLSKTN